jgi:GTP cyclohydrolase III
MRRRRRVEAAFGGACEHAPYDASSYVLGANSTEGAAPSPDRPDGLAIWQVWALRSFCAREWPE